VIAFAAATLLAAAWPPTRGVVDVQVRNPNLGDPGCVIMQDATLRCWPSAFSVGQWQSENWPRPQLEARPELAGIRAFGGRDCLLLDKGRVRCMRDGTFRDIGVSGAVEVASNGEMGCARSKDGGVSCWGSNKPPVRVQDLPPVKSLALAAGACGLTEDGAVFCWGQHLFAPVAPRSDSRAERIASMPALARLWVGPLVALGVTTDGRLLAWKPPTYGEAARLIRIPSAEKLGARVVDASVSYDFAVLVLGDGSVWLWGHQPGTLQQIPALPPTWADPIRRVSGVNDAVKVSAASEHVCLVTRVGQVRCFGSNQWGQLGDGAIGTKPVTIPTAIVEISEATLPDPVTKQCIATRKDRLACLHEGAQCILRSAPPPVVCAGGAYRPDRLVQPVPPQPLQDCLCSCSQRFRELASAQLRQQQICSMIPSRAAGPPRPPAPAPATR
jgi:alpha-tubulin suppressor-like RCC1 family protein